MDTDGFRGLVQRAQDGDREALDRLLAAVRPDLERWARRYQTPDQPEASVSDLVQSVCVRVWQKLDQFDLGADDEQTQGQFRAWMSRIVQRLGLNAVRRRTTRKRKPDGPLLRLPATGSDDSATGAGPPAGDVPTPSAQAKAGEATDLIRLALERLADDTDRAIVRLRFFEGLSLRQIADRLQLSQDKVRERYHAGMRRLESDLGGLS